MPFFEINMQKIVSSNCQICEQPTSQKVLFCRARIEKDEDLENGGIFKTKIKNEYMVIQCSNCHNISFLERTIFLEPNEPRHPLTIIEMNYPGPSEPDFNFLNEYELHDLPKCLERLYQEVIAAFKNEAEILSGLGLRTLVEAICIEQNVRGANLQTKIVALKGNGLISANEELILDKLRLIGNVAAHQIKGIPLEILAYALEIINHVLRSIYILPKINRKIKIR